MGRELAYLGMKAGRSALFAGLCLAGMAFGKSGFRGLWLLAVSKGRAFGPSK